VQQEPSIKINRVELYFLKIPLTPGRLPFFRRFAKRTVFRPSWIPGFHQTDVRLYLLKLATDSGHEGFAAMPAIGTERVGLGPLLGTYIIGLNPLDICLLNQRIQEFNYVGMRNGWVDAAVWDLIGKIRGEPLWKILGGTGGAVYPYASFGETHDLDPHVVAAIAQQRCEEGFRGVKIRVRGRDVSRMVAVVAAVRDAVGSDIELMVDANLGWPVDLVLESPRWDEDFAAHFAQMIEAYDVAWLEEPLHTFNFEGLSRLRKRTKTPIAGGELLSSYRDFKAMLDLESLDVYQPDAVLAGGVFAGGISEVYWLIREIEKRRAMAPEGATKVRYSPHTWSNGLGFAVNLQMVGLIPEHERLLVEMPYDVNWQPQQWACFLDTNFPREPDGRIRIPDAPGLGVEIDWSIVRRFGERIYEGTPRSVAVATVRDIGVREAMSLQRRRQPLLDRSARTELRLPEPPF
jgi:D-galactarolactone cycloisomerase